MATAKKLPSGNYRVRIYTGKKPDGSPQYKSFTAETKKEAERQAALYENEIKQKEYNGLTVGEVIDIYIRNSTNVLSPASIRKYDSMRRNSYKDIEDKYVKDMKQPDYQAFVNAFSMDHAPKTVDSVCGLLTASLKALDNETNLTLKRPKKKPSTIAIPTDDQVKHLIDNAGRPEMQLAFVMAAALGLRRSEICALSWEDVDDKTLHIKKAMVQTKDGDWIIKSTKTNAGTRDLEMPDYLIQKIKGLKPDGVKETDRIFPFTPGAITMRFHRASRDAGINCRFHDLRHYNASIMLALGVPDKYAMLRMGHATPNMLKRVYQHTIDEKEKEVSDEVNKYMEKFNS